MLALQDRVFALQQQLQKMQLERTHNQAQLAALRQYVGVLPTASALMDNLVLCVASRVPWTQREADNCAPAEMHSIMLPPCSRCHCMHANHERWQCQS